MHTKERATVTLTAETLRKARVLIPNLNLSALCNSALEATVREAEENNIRSSYAEFPNHFDDEIDWGKRYGMSEAEQQRLMNNRRPWTGDEGDEGDE